MTDTTQMTEQEILEKADELGYDPNRYPKDDPRWKTPEEFIEFGEKVAPILAENNKRYEQMYRSSQKELQQLRQEVSKFAKLHEETEKRVREQTIAELKLKKREAYEAGDIDAVMDIDDQIADERDAQKVEPTTVDTEQKSKPDMHIAEEAFNAWSAKNSSWLQDEELQMAAQIVGQQLRNRGVPYQGEDFADYLDKVTVEVKKRYPDKFTETAPLQSVESSGERSTGGVPKRHSYANLPREAKEACDFLVATIPGMTREKYLATYKWSK